METINSKNIRGLRTESQDTITEGAVKKREKLEIEDMRGVGRVQWEIKKLRRICLRGKNKIKRGQRQREF